MLTFPGGDGPRWTRIAFVAAPFVVLVIILFVALIQADDDAAGNESIEGTDWQLRLIQIDGDLSPVIEGSTTSLSLQNTNASGSAGCNSFRGGYELDGGSLAFGPLSATRRLCIDPPGIDGQESTYLALLSEVDTADVVEGELVLSSAGEVALVFTASTAASGD